MTLLVFFIKDKKLKNIMNKELHEKTFLSIEGSYSNLEITLFQNQKNIQTLSENNLKASSKLILAIDSILKQNKITLSDLDFIAVNQGPGAFTSLRVVISTVNGISFANKIPLIGIDGLDALSLQTLKEFDFINSITKPTMLISLLNAYNNEVYFSVNKIIENELEKIIPNNYKKIDLFLDEISKQFANKKILFTGNGTILHKGLIQEKFGSNAIFQKNILQTPSAKQIGIMALQKSDQQKEFKLKPLYLKSQAFIVKK